MTTYQKLPTHLINHIHTTNTHLQTNYTLRTNKHATTYTNYATTIRISITPTYPPIKSKIFNFRFKQTYDILLEFHSIAHTYYHKHNYTIPLKQTTINKIIEQIAEFTKLHNPSTSLSKN